jgi:choline/glycine/proline betaine transport protein
MFIARVSRGRTISEFVSGVLLIPTGMIFVWFTVFGGTGLHLELQGDAGLVAAVQEDYGMAIFRLFEHFPLTQLAVAVAIVMIVVWFVTSSDSGSFVIDMLTAGGDEDPPVIQRVFWAITEGVVAALLLVAGGLAALQAAAIVAGFPFALVMLIMMYALIRGLSRDKLTIYRTKLMFETDEEAAADMSPATADEKEGPGRERES